jgi:hypothetical protein
VQDIIARGHKHTPQVHEFRVVANHFLSEAEIRLELVELLEHRPQIPYLVLCCDPDREQDLSTKVMHDDRHGPRQCMLDPKQAAARAWTKICAQHISEASGTHVVHDARFLTLCAQVAISFCFSRIPEATV